MCFCWVLLLSTKESPTSSHPQMKILSFLRSEPPWRLLYMQNFLKGAFSSWQFAEPAKQRAGWPSGHTHSHGQCSSAMKNLHILTSLPYSTLCTGKPGARHLLPGLPEENQEPTRVELNYIIQEGGRWWMMPGIEKGGQIKLVMAFPP